MTNKVLLRNRRFVRPFPSDNAATEEEEEDGFVLLTAADQAGTGGAAGGSSEQADHRAVQFGPTEEIPNLLWEPFQSVGGDFA